MIRPVKADEINAVLDIAGAIGFEPDELEALRAMIDACLNDAEERGEWIACDLGSGPIAIAYFAPEKMTRGTWNLLLLAVRPESQGGGHGTALLRHVERELARRGERLLLIETSGTEDFEPARAFYRKNGYDEEATIRDFYDAGDDKIVFRKAL